MGMRVWTTCGMMIGTCDSIHSKYRDDWEDNNKSIHINQSFMLLLQYWLYMHYWLYQLRISLYFIGLSMPVEFWPESKSSIVQCGNVLRIWHSCRFATVMEMSHYWLNVKYWLIRLYHTVINIATNLFINIVNNFIDI